MYVRGSEKVFFYNKFLSNHLSFLMLCIESPTTTSSSSDPLCDQLCPSSCVTCVFTHQCKKKHTLVCPDFSKTGVCPRGARCKLQHRQRDKSSRNASSSASSSSSTPQAKRSRTKEPSRRWAGATETVSVCVIQGRYSSLKLRLELKLAVKKMLKKQLKWK